MASNLIKVTLSSDVGSIPVHLETSDLAPIAAIGTTTDSAVVTPTGEASLVALMKGLLTKLADPATQTTLAQVQTVLDTLVTYVDGLEALLTAIRDTTGVKRIVDPVDVSDRAGRVLGKVSADDGAIAALGALAAAAVTDPTAAASVIALLKGLLRQLQGAGTGSMPVTLNGRNAVKAATLLYNTPLAGAASWVSPTMTASQRSIGNIKGIVSVGLLIAADTPTAVYLTLRDANMSAGENNKTQDYIIHDGSNRPTIMPIQPLLADQFNVVVTNLSATAQTRCRIVLIESAIYENETLFTQTLPLDGGNITLAGGAFYQSVVMRIPRVARISFGVTTPTSAATHTVRANFWGDEAGTQLVDTIKATKQSDAGLAKDLYVINVDAKAPFVSFSILNGSATSATFSAYAYGYPR